MNKDNTEKLFSEFPRLFRGKDETIQTNLMPFGFECGDGWYDLIRSLAKTIQMQCEHRGIDVKATQVKEKYGSLRFYYNGGDDFVEGAVWLAEELSAFICEKCGAPGETRSTGGWLRTLCDSCPSSR
jgi:hypothetical protein